MGMIGRIYVGTTKHCYILNKQAFGLVDSEKEICLCFSFYKPMTDDAPGAWPFWTPGEWLAGSIKGITKHCYTQYIKALRLMITEIFLCFSYCKSVGANDLPGVAN